MSCIIGVLTTVAVGYCGYVVGREVGRREALRYR
jgi:hypothetical protein